MAFARVSGSTGGMTEQPSRDQNFDENEDYWLGGHLMHHEDPLPPGESYTCTGQTRNTIPHWNPGTYYLILIPDTHSCAMTLDKNAGRDYRVIPVTLDYSNPPDLRVSHIDVPTAAFSGQDMELGWKVENNGAGTGNYYWLDAVFLSTDTKLDGDLNLGDKQHRGNVYTSQHYEVTGETF